MKFQYYDVCPFKENKIEILEVILKYSELFSSIYNKILILSSLCDKYYKDSIPYLVKIYHSFINDVYEVPLDEMDLIYICETMAKINALEFGKFSVSLGAGRREKDDVIEVLKEVLSKDDVDEKYVRDFLKCNSIDKYSDKIDIDKILFIYKYGSKKAKKIAVDEKLRTI